MGWLSNKIGGWAIDTQRKELAAFVANLTPLDGEEIGFTLAIATDRRHALNSMFGWNMLSPVVVATQDQSSAIKLNGIIRNLQKDKNLPAAAGLMIWLHTLRAANSLELRQLGRDMWKQLERGFPHVENAVESMIRMNGPLLNVEGYDEFPEGLTPRPL